MNRKKKLFLNLSTSLVYQIVLFVCGFILPRMFLDYYGSEVNGLVSSITQFLNFITLCECGVGAVVQSALYKPLAENDIPGISRIVVSSDRFFRRIGYILVAYVLFLVVAYPLVINSSFDYFYTVALILAISISIFAQYFFGMTNRLLLTADQLGFVQYLTFTITTVLNTVCSVILMWAGASIHQVKLVSSLIFLLQPVVMAVAVRRRYTIDRKIQYDEEPIQQKWNGLAQHIAAVVLGNTGVVVLTVFGSLKDVSVYTVYNLVVGGVKTILLSMTNGVQAMLGNMLAKDEKEELDAAFGVFEWLVHAAVTLCFLLTAVLLIPFVRVYTKGITDANYLVPAFAYVFTMAWAMYCLRLPYNTMVLAAGHYKQTQSSAIIEVVIHIGVSVILVFPLGLVGVAMGTLCAMIYRTIYLAWYLQSHILNRSIKYFVKNILSDAASVGAFLLVMNCAPGFFAMTERSYFGWFFLAVKAGIVCLAVVFGVNAVFYPQLFRQGIKILNKK